MKYAMKQQKVMRPQDILVLLKIVALGDQPWYHHNLADALFMSQSEVSLSLSRSRYAGLIDGTRKKVMSLALMELLQYGIRYVFPQQPGPVVRGVPTAHSAPPLKDLISSNEQYVWPAATGSDRGQSIIPIYPSVPNAVKLDEILYSMLVLLDAIRVGKAREREMAIDMLKKQFNR
jgi:hypothetical protein